MKKIRNVIAFLVAAVALVFTGGHALADDTGSITIQNAEVGQRYTLYKLFDATVGDNGAIAYTLPSGKTAEDVASYFDVDAAGNVTAKSTTTQSVVGSDDFKTWAKAFAGSNPTQGPVQATSNTVTFDNLAFGYYFIESSLGATITVDSTTPHAYVVDKNADGPNNATKDANLESAKIGDTVNYTVKYNATNYVMVSGEGKQITDYTIVDTPTNLAINANSVVVKVKGRDTQIEQTITPQSVNVDSTTGKLTVVLPWVNTSTGASLYDTPSEVTITYSATVLPGAAGVTALTGQATNGAKITYAYDGGSNYISTETESVKTYGFTIIKTDGTNTLTGAEFKVYDSETSTTPLKFVKLSDTMYRIAVSTDAASDCVEVIPAGMTYISGLKDGSNFFLEEIKAPAGYNKLTSRQEVVVNKDRGVASVLNHKGAELPSTGSFGTRMLYVVGAAAILVASVYMVAKRRVKNL
ncbi:LPXTG-motif cell wall anchor domain-containing protein [Streptococcus equinus]|uniref:SpaA isopeptide-forming pilin-related protein n=1 Tax=Streptococcus equinus TaxID=1335 RepID=UPI000880A0A3|nr:SpaA isopeptide-forming pilin-related protein [Streptococcus equinus]SDQ03041.1 LPXTG-motif cell wall anchor domain-containing protein [Streptococcus equinus]SEK18668.1 LPXTG-motif cell wall anchor domain-containing protein [Streptococcus equinus]